MKIRILTVLLIFMNVLVAVSQQNFDNAFHKFLSDPDYQNATIGIQVDDLNSGGVLFSFNSEKLIIPASTMKLATSAAALEILGAGYRFSTKIGYSGDIKENTLTGDLVIIGGGDPALGSEYFHDFYEKHNFMDTWARKIKDAGIKEIKGNLVLDGSLYDSEKIPPTWMWEDIGNYYGAGASALTVYDNLCRITFSSPVMPGKLTKIISICPDAKWLEITNEVLSSDDNRDLAYVFGSPLDNRRVIRGTIPKNQKAFTIKAAVHCPERLLAENFIPHLAKEGIFISGGVKFKKTDMKNFQAIYKQESPELAEIVTTLNHESVNLFAEHLVKQIAVERTGQGSREKGLGIIKNFWQSKGMKGHFFMEDGSGLSHFNAASPSQFVFLLKYMDKSKNAGVFFNSLPSASTGTLTGFSPDFFKGDSLKAKSGSMTCVRCYSGYLSLNSGGRAAFSIMVNQFAGGHAKLKREIERLLWELMRSY